METTSSSETLLGVTVTVLVLMENNAACPPLSHAPSLSVFPVLPLSHSNSSLREAPAVFRHSRSDVLIVPLSICFFFLNPPHCLSLSCNAAHLPVVSSKAGGLGGLQIPCLYSSLSKTPTSNCFMKQSCQMEGATSDGDVWGSEKQKGRESLTVSAALISIMWIW